MSELAIGIVFMGKILFLSLSLSKHVIISEWVRERMSVLVSCYLGLPDQSVRMSVSDAIHHTLNGCSDLLWVGVATIDYL